MDNKHITKGGLVCYKAFSITQPIRKKLKVWTVTKELDIIKKKTKITRCYYSKFDSYIT